MNTWLLIDNSNSRTKFALGDGGGLKEWRKICATAEVDDAYLQEILAEIHVEGVVISSVVPKTRQLLEAFFARHGLPVEVLSASSPMGMVVDYPNPQQLGADRLANACGGLHRYGAPCMVIDFGTAVTYDLVDARGAYIGGVIAPGVKVVNDYLPSHTALLPVVEFEQPQRMIGTSTQEAMQVGAVIGYYGMVKEIIERMVGELRVRPKIIATGGDAEMIARGVGLIDVVDQGLTLEGLRVVAAQLEFSKES